MKTNLKWHFRFNFKFLHKKTTHCGFFVVFCKTIYTFTITFNPNYNYFRIYLVVNGSDIGEQFSDATMKIGSLKIQSID